MEEKVIHEVRVVETEDGFRIEIKGDKEQLRELVTRITRFAGGGGKPPMGPFMRHFRHRWHGGHGFGPWWANVPENEPPSAENL